MIRQPGYLPYLGFFKKIMSSDIFVYLDDVQYSVGGGDNRNKIRTSSGWKYLSVPLAKPFGKMINEIEIANSKNWRDEHKNSIKAHYTNAEYFNDYWDEIENVLENEWKKLIHLNLELISLFNKFLGIKTKTLRSSELGITTKKSERLLDICKKLDATTYISGEMGKGYLDEDVFQHQKINILYEKFQHPTYKQMYDEFISHMSIIDLLFNEGPKSREILIKCNNL